MYVCCYYILLHVWVIRIDQHQVEKYRYRRKSGTEELLFCGTSPSVPVFVHLMRVNMCGRNMY